MEDDSGHPDAATSMAIEKDVELLSNAPAGEQPAGKPQGLPLQPQDELQAFSETCSQVHHKYIQRELNLTVS